MRTISKLIWSGAAFALPVLGLWSIGHFADVTQPAQTANAARVTTSATPSAGGKAFPDSARTPLESRWQVGARVTYDLDYTEWVDRTELGAALVTVGARGPMLVTVVADDGTARLLEVSLEALSISFADEQTDLATARQMRADARDPFYVKHTHGGVIPGLYTRRGLDGHSLRLRRNLAAVLQFVPASAANSPTWSVEETGVDGRYLAHYRRERGAVEKRKDRMVLSDAAPSGTQIDSVSTFQLGSDGFIEQVSFTENVLIPIGSTNVRAFGNINLTLRDARLTTSLAPALSDLEFHRLDGTRGREQRDTQDDAALARGHTFAGLAEELNRYAAGDAERYLAARERLVALLRTNPEAIRHCLEALRAELTMRERASLMGALSDAATPEAQSALIGLAKDQSAPLDMREDAMINASLTGTPTEDTVNALAELSRDGDPELRAQATLALGAASGSAKNSGDANAKLAATRAISELESGLRDAESGQDKLTYASALGNVGGDVALAASREALADADELIRAQGATSLRLVEDGVADSLLANLLVDDPSPLVRGRAAAATHFRGENSELIAALDAAARTDEDLAVRQSALGAISEHVSTSEEARASVAWLAEHEPNPALRQTAREALVDPSRGGPGVEAAAQIGVPEAIEPTPEGSGRARDEATSDD